MAITDSSSYLSCHIGLTKVLIAPLLGQPNAEHAPHSSKHVDEMTVRSLDIIFLSATTPLQTVFFMSLFSLLASLALIPVP